MTECRQIESLLASFVDGAADAVTVQTVERHLAACASCRAQVHAEQTARIVLRSRAAAISDGAPPGLRTRIVASLAGADHDPGPSFRWARLAWRVSAFAAAVVVVLAVATGLELMTPRSNVLYAAQLAIDHVRCFVAEKATRKPADAGRLQQQLATNYGWAIRVPPSYADLGIMLVAARRCPYWLGDHAHLLYRRGGREISLYVTLGAQWRDGDFRVLGHSEKLWWSQGALYTLVADDLDAAEFSQVSGYFQTQTLTP